MKKFLLSLALVAFAVSASMAQTANVSAPQVKKECCKDHKDGQKCDKPADQQCPDCKEKAAKQCDKAAMKECKKAEGMKHECKKAEGQKCEKAEGMKHECKKAEGMKHECKEGAAKQCDKGAIKKMHEECKDHKDGQPCTKPADQQCPDCKEKAAAKKN